MAATQIAIVVVGLSDLGVFFRKTELGAEDGLYNQCGGWGGYRWHLAM